MMRKLSNFFSFLLVSAILAPVPGFSGMPAYPWTSEYDPADAMANRIAPAPGYERSPLHRDSFGYWLRHLPLKKGNPPVSLHNGEKKRNQSAHVAVVRVDVGTRDLQQCADAVIRLRAEYLYAKAAYGDIRFRFTSGDNASLEKWRQGWRPMVKGNRVSWRKTRKPDTSYAAFREYLDTVFMYAGTHSLSKELEPVDVRDMRVGDVFIQGGFPGHAVIVVDMAVNRKNGKTLFLLAQSYMPAQDIHILKNPWDENLSPWYESGFGETLRTPEWTFGRDQLRRFPEKSRKSASHMRKLLEAYPDHLVSGEGNVLRWKDGTEMAFDDGNPRKDFETLLNSPDLEDQLSMPYPAGRNDDIPLENSDPGRIRHEPFFLKMYGDSSSAVQANLASVSWLPRTVGRRVRISAVNRVDEKLGAVSRELDMLPAGLKKYVRDIGGTFNWRKISGTRRLSPHSFGIAIDINTAYADYWRWDGAFPNYKNRIPMEIVEIFEKHGFIWGGKWYHYDTMHFEYRPELLVN